MPAGSRCKEARPQGAGEPRHAGDASDVVALVPPARCRKYDGSSRRGTVRPRRTPEIVELVLRIARENSGWGYTRIRGTLNNVGYDIGRYTIKRILLEAGIDPAPERSKRISWSAFLRAHWAAIAAMDFTRD